MMIDGDFELHSTTFRGFHAMVCYLFSIETADCMVMTGCQRMTITFFFNVHHFKLEYFLSPWKNMDTLNYCCFLIGKLMMFTMGWKTYSFAGKSGLMQ